MSQRKTVKNTKKMEMRNIDSTDLQRKEKEDGE